MSFHAQNTEIKTRFNTVWAKRIPVDLPNTKFNLPSPPAAWCRFRILNSDARRTTIGASANNFRNTGLITIQIFVPIDTGDAAALTHADDAANIFRDWCGTNVICRAPIVKDVGVDGSGYYQVNCIIPFVRNELL